MRQDKPYIILIMLFLFAAAIAYPITCIGEEIELTAFSFHVAEKYIQSKDLKNISPEVNYLGYITRPKAIFVDRKGTDIILIGIRDKKFPSLSLDDFTAALRCNYFYGIPPGVTIDPSGKDDLQDVRYFCGIENTNFGKVCFESDYLLKKLAFEKEHIEIPIKSYYQLAIDRFKSNTSLTWNTASKFWFYLIAGGVNVSDDVAYLPEARIGVLSQTLFAEENGQSVANPLAYDDIPAKEFTQSITLQFVEFTKADRLFANLQNLYELQALSKGLVQLATITDFGYWLVGYQIKNEVTPSVAKLLTAAYSDGRRKLNLSGGVQMASITFRLQKNQFSALANAALLSRPSPDTLTWNFVLQRDYSLSFPSLAPEERQLAMLFTQGLLFYQIRDYNAALEHFEKMLNVNPDISEAWMIKGMVLRDWGLSNYSEKKLAMAIECFKKAANMNPRVISLHTEFGKTLHAVGMTDDSIREFQKAIDIRPDYAPSYYGLGLALKTKGDASGAIAAFEQYLTYDRSKERADEARKFIIALQAKEDVGERVQAADTKTYSTSENKFRCEYPKDWLLLSRNELIEKSKGRFSPPEDLVVAFVSPENFDDNVNIQVAQVDEENLSDKDIEDTIKELDKVYAENYTDFKKIKTTIVTVSGAKGFEYLYSSSRLGVPLQQRVIILVKSKRAYTITFTALKEHFEKLDNSIFRPLLETFIIQ